MPCRLLDGIVRIYEIADGGGILPTIDVLAFLPSLKSEGDYGPNPAAVKNPS